MDGNKNIMHVEAIEGLMIQVNDHLEMIDPKYHKEHLAKEQALQAANEFQTIYVHTLRILCEGD